MATFKKLNGYLGHTNLVQAAVTCWKVFNIPQSRCGWGWSWLPEQGWQTAAGAEGRSPQAHLAQLNHRWDRACSQQCPGENEEKDMKCESEKRRVGITCWICKKQRAPIVSLLQGPASRCGSHQVGAIECTEACMHACLRTCVKELGQSFTSASWGLVGKNLLLKMSC